MNNEYSLSFKVLGIDQATSDVRRMIAALEQMASAYDSLLRKMQQSYNNATSRMGNMPGMGGGGSTTSGGAASTGASMAGAGSLDSQLMKLNQQIMELPNRLEQTLSRAVTTAMRPTSGTLAAATMTSAGGVEAELNGVARHLNEAAGNLNKAGLNLERMGAIARAGVASGDMHRFEGTLRRVVEEMGRSGMGTKVPMGAIRPPSFPSGWSMAADPTGAVLEHERRMEEYKTKIAQKNQYAQLEPLGLASNGYMIQDPRLASVAMNIAGNTYANPKALPNRSSYYRMSNAAATGADEDEILESLGQGSGSRGVLSNPQNGLISYAKFGGRHSHVVTNLLQTGMFGAGAALGYGALNILGTNFHEQLDYQYKQASVDNLLPANQRDRFNGNLNQLARKYSVPTTEAYDVGFKMQGTFGNTTDSLKATNAVLLLARTSTIELTQAMNDLVAITDSFNLGADGMGKIVNGLVGLQKNFGVSTEQMVQSMARLGDLMNQLGFDPEHAATLIAVGQRATGVSGDQLASKFERVLPRFLDPKAQSIISEIGTKDNLGVGYQDFLSGAPNVQNILYKLSKGYNQGKMSEGDFQSLAVALGQQRNMAVFAPMLKEFAGPKGNKAFGAMTGGEENKDAEKRWAHLQNTALMNLKGLETSVTQLTQEIAQGGLLQAFTLLAAGIKDVVAVGVDVLHFFNGITDALGPLGTGLKTVAAAWLMVAAAQKAMGASGMSGWLHGGGALPAGGMNKIVSSADAEGDLVGLGSIYGLSARRRIEAAEKLRMAAEGTHGTVPFIRDVAGDLTYTQPLIERAKRDAAAAAAGIMGPGIVASHYLSGSGYGSPGLTPLEGPAKSLYIPEAPFKEAVPNEVKVLTESIGLMTAFNAGIKTSVSWLGQMAVAAATFTRRLLESAMASLGSSLGGAPMLGALAPGATGRLRTMAESGMAARLAAGGMAGEEAAATAGAMSSGAAASFLAGSAILPAVGIAAGVYGVNNFITGLTHDPGNYAKQSKETKDNTAKFLAAKSTQDQISTLDTAVKQGQATEDARSFGNKTWDFFVGGGDSANIRIGALGLEHMSKQDLKDLGVRNFGAAGLKYHGSFYDDNNLAPQKLVTALSAQKQKQQQQRLMDQQNKMLAQGFDGLDPTTMQFLQSDMASAYLYGGTSLDILGNKNGGQPNVSTQSVTFSSYIKRVGKDITEVQADIAQALKDNNVDLAQTLEQTKNQLLSQKIQLQNQFDQAQAALTGFSGSATQGAAANVTAAKNILGRYSDPNSPEAMQAQLAYNQANLASAQSPYDQAATALTTLGNITQVPSDKVAILQQSASIAMQRAQITMQTIGNPNNSTVQQAMSSAIEATSAALQAFNQAQLDAINAAGALEQSQTRNPVTRAQIQLKTDRAALEQIRSAQGSERALAAGKTGNAALDGMISILKTQAEMQTQDLGSASTDMSQAADQHKTAATLWQKVAGDFSTVLHSVLKWVTGTPAAPSHANTFTTGGTTMTWRTGRDPGDIVPGSFKTVSQAPTYTSTSFAKAVLAGIGAPGTKANVNALVAWEGAEGGNWRNTASFNPLNTTQPMGGSRVMAGGNSAGVQAFNSWADGLAATVKTLQNGNYGGILSALMKGNNSSDVLNAVVNSPWGTKHISASGKSYNPVGAGFTGMVAGGKTPAEINQLAKLNDDAYALAQAGVDQLNAFLLKNAGAASQPRQLDAEIQGLRAKIKVDKSFQDLTNLYRDQTSLQKDIYDQAQENVQEFYQALQLKTDVTNPVTSLDNQLQMLSKQMAAYLKAGGKKTDSAYLSLQVQQKNDLRDKALAQTQLSLHDEDFAFSMHQEGWLQHIQNLRKLRDTVNTQTRAGVELWQQINLEIQGMVDSLSGGQFNIPDLGKLMPTVYEARRMAQGGTAGGVIPSTMPVPITGFASGTDFAPGGLSLVGELGPELMSVPRGSSIINNQKISTLLSQLASANAIGYGSMRSNSTDGLMTASLISTMNDIKNALSRTTSAPSAPNVQININGGDINAVKDAVSSAIGPSAMGRFASVGRKSW